MTREEQYVKWLVERCSHPHDDEVEQVANALRSALRQRVPEAVRQLPGQWRKMLNRTDAGYYSMTVCADELERAIAQEESDG